MKCKRVYGFIFGGIYTPNKIACEFAWITGYFESPPFFIIHMVYGWLVNSRNKILLPLGIWISIRTFSVKSVSEKKYRKANKTYRIRHPNPHHHFHWESLVIANRQVQEYLVCHHLKHNNIFIIRILKSDFLLGICIFRVTKLKNWPPMEDRSNVAGGVRISVVVTPSSSSLSSESSSSASKKSSSSDEE